MENRKEGERCTYWIGRFQVFQRKIRIDSKIRNCVKALKSLEVLKIMMLTACGEEKSKVSKKSNVLHRAFLNSDV